MASGSDKLAAEYDASGTLLRRYLHGPNPDQPLVWYEGATMANPRWLHTDERGSVIAVADTSYNPIIRNSYDEWGTPATTNAGRFQYTGQAWVPELGLYYYKARMYAPALGRFMQTDPIGYADQINLYAYAGNDPINGDDATGLCTGSFIEDKGGECAGGGTISGAGSCIGNCSPSHEFQVKPDHADGSRGNENMSSPAAPSADNKPVTLSPLNGNQEKQAYGIFTSRPVLGAMRDAVRASVRDGRERGFFIYSHGSQYRPGATSIGSSDEMPKSFARTFEPIDPENGHFDIARAYFHIHTGDYLGVDRADSRDQDFGRNFGIFTIIWSVRGFTVGY